MAHGLATCAQRSSGEDDLHEIKFGARGCGVAGRLIANKKAWRRTLDANIKRHCTCNSARRCTPRPRRDVAESCGLKFLLGNEYRSRALRASR